jgi:hypothetical protein
MLGRPSLKLVVVSELPILLAPFPGKRIDPCERVRANLTERLRRIFRRLPREKGSERQRGAHNLLGVREAKGHESPLRASRQVGMQDWDRKIARRMNRPIPEAVYLLQDAPKVYRASGLEMECPSKYLSDLLVPRSPIRPPASRNLVWYVSEWFDLRVQSVDGRGDCHDRLHARTKLTLKRYPATLTVVWLRRQKNAMMSLCLGQMLERNLKPERRHAER